MLKHVLVALDGSRSADGALMFAIELSRQFDSDLILSTAIDREAAIASASAPDGPFLGFESVIAHYETTAKTLLEAASARATAAGARVTTVVLDGRPAVAIVDYARDAAVDAIVMGTHGRRGLERMFLGSTADGVLRMTTVPTFVIRQQEDTANAAAPIAAPHAVQRILVAVDDSEPSDAALAFAVELAAEKQGVLICCNAVEPGDLIDKAETFGYSPAPLLQSLNMAATAFIESKAGSAKQHGLKVESIVVEANAADAILDTAASQSADLIVVGTHGRRGLRRLVIGSVAESVVRRSTLPVAVVRISAGRSATP